MLEIDFKSYRVFEKNNDFVAKIVVRNTRELPDGDVLLRVKYSSLNYKDALSAAGHKGITRQYPHTPGIDAAGIVVDSLNEEFKKGDKVIVTGYDLGMNTDGGFAEYVRVPAGWVTPLPKGLTLKESMILGTAGFTAGLCIYEFQRRGLTPEMGKILVTGATGGVGSVSVSMLHKLGYEVVGITGKSDGNEYLKKLGACLVLSRQECKDEPNRPLLERKWAGAIDNVGGDTLNYCIKSTDYWGTVACVGLVASDKLQTTVYPFLLRGIGLVGIDSADRPMELRRTIWTKLSAEWKPTNLEFLSREIGMRELSDELNKFKNGGQKGRIILKL